MGGTTSTTVACDFAFDPVEKDTSCASDSAAQNSKEDLYIDTRLRLLGVADIATAQQAIGNDLEKFKKYVLEELVERASASKEAEQARDKLLARLLLHRPDAQRTKEVAAGREHKAMVLDCDDKALEKSDAEILVKASHPDFWRVNAQHHPLFPRVKNWLWVHERYRTQIAVMIANRPADADHKADKAGHNWKATFGTFCSFLEKLEGHTGFEETMLFKFVREKIPKDNAVLNLYPVGFEALTSQHNELIPKLINATLTEFKEKFKLVNEALAPKPMEGEEEEALFKGKDVRALLHDFQTLFIQHLRDEERAMVLPWLSWNEEQYGQYREYLSFKFSVMY